ncbi:hypothetical protein T4D_16976 [Trichinella pseudospiralis]|uniref:Uncharacterized protein n=1 Tax=Trichinella pseudospiralis TaxID=6337 RepID=A0A0V1FT71_TRIPS|nr:hypothetical protein T4D_16976 [Trichinella pseudospiralis]
MASVKLVVVQRTTPFYLYLFAQFADRLRRLSAWTRTDWIHCVHQVQAVIENNLHASLSCLEKLILKITLSDQKRKKNNFI